jgi:hypothetical protein
MKYVSNKTADQIKRKTTKNLFLEMSHDFNILIQGWKYRDFQNKKKTRNKKFSNLTKLFQN